MPITILILFLILFLIVVILPIIVPIVIANFTKKNNPIQNYNSEEADEIKYCSNCGAEINGKSFVCLKCGCAINKLQSHNPQDTQSAGLNILSCFFPLIGLILYVTFNATPQKAKGCGKCALIGFIIGTGINLMLLLLILLG